MNDKIAVGVGNRITDVEKQSEAFRNAELAACRSSIEVNAVDVLHDEIWLARVAEAGIEHAGDVGVIE